MNWIDHGYDLVWDKLSVIAREMKNSESSLETQDFVTKAIAEMVEAGTASALPLDVRPTEII